MSDSIGGVDASIPLQAGRGVTPLINPLTAYSNALTLRAQMNQNALFPGQMALQQQAVQGGALDLANRTNTNAYQALTPLLSDPNLTHDTLTNALAGVERSGISTSGVIQRIAQAPNEDGPAFQQSIRNIIGAGALTGFPQNQINYVRPGQGLVDTGQQLQGVSIAPQSSATPGALTPAGPGIQKFTGPETNAQLISNYVRMPDPNNPGQFIYQPVQTPRSALPGASGATMPPNGMQGPPPGAPGAPGMSGPPPSPQNPPRLPGAAPTAGMGAPTGSILSAPPPNVAAAQAKDIDAFKSDQSSLPARQTSVQNLEHAYDALQLTVSGKSTETTNAMYNYLQSFGLLPPGATNDLKNYELFRKYTERNIADLGNASGTDAGRALAAQSNAGTSLSTLANVDVLRNDIGKQRQAIAQTMTAPDQSTGLGYGAYSGNFANTTDPRGFEWDLLPVPQQQQILSSMKPGSVQWNNLHRAIGMATKLGLFGRPSIPAPSGTPPVAPGAPPTGAPAATGQ